MDRRWLLGGLLITAGVGLAALATRRPKLSASSRVLLFGDSLAVGLNPQFQQLATEAGVTYEGFGVVGSRIQAWLDNPQLDDALAAFKPTLILVSLGTNNEAEPSAGAADRAAPALAALLDKLHATGAEIVWIGPPTLPFPRQGVSDLIRANVSYFFDSALLDIPRSPDGLHPNAAGYAGWAGAIWQWLT